MSNDQNEPAETPSLAESTYESRYYASIALSDNYRPSRLGFLHILAWMGVSVLLIVLNLALLTYLESGYSRADLIRLANKVFTSGNSILTAAILVGGAVMLIDFLRGKPGRLQPGHWFLAINALFFPFYLAAQFVGPFLEKFIKSNHSSTTYFIYSGIEFMLMLAYFGGAFRLKEPPWWRCGLGLLGLATGYLSLQYLAIPFCLHNSLNSILSLTQYTTPFICLIVAICLFLLMLTDISKGARRDWLHWLGVVYPMLIALIRIVWQVATIFLVRYSSF
jgi:hypothetical protein